MTVITRFWSPCLVYTNLNTACYAIAGYTVAASVVLITLTKYMMAGGESTELYFPFFENDVRNSMITYGTIAIVFLFYMILSAAALVHGVLTSLRGYLLPWLFGMMFIILFQLLWSIWLLYGYYIYIQIVVPAIIYWLWAAYNFYCWLCVYTQYKIIARMQSPNIELIYS
ncbi:uncharacterized protein pasi1 [Planococcus citri]|uniref:uncharacterized protein pasi1 n=1 Tax=Planococcus citri TaxID=170843 RepID=UPI0031F77C6D